MERATISDMTSEEDILARLYPRQAAYLQKLVDSGKIHHTYGFVGVSEGAQEAFALQFTQQLLGKAYPLTQHPDFLRVSTPVDRNTLGVEEAKAVRDHLLRRPLLGTYRVVMIDHADLLTTAAANALLKIFEEPPEFGVILCTTSAPYVLPATIRSRMQFVHFPVVSLAQTVDVLQSHGVDDQQIQSTIDVVQGKFERLIHVLAKDSAAQDQTEEQAFWLHFIAAKPAERDTVIQQYLGTGEASQEAAHTIGHVLDILESLFHGSIMSQSEKRHTATIPQLAQKPSPLDRYTFNELADRVQTIQRLREMVAHNVQKKMLFDYLTLAL